MAKGHNLESIEEDMNKLGIHRRVNREHNRIEWGVKCTECPTEDYRPFSANSPPLLLEKKFKQSGWEVNKNCPPVCPACAEKHQLANRAKHRKEPDPMKIGISIDPKITRRVFKKLDEVFDCDRFVYQAGYTDARVANECDTSLEVVTHLRKEAYGELAEDPVVVELNQRLDELVETHQKTIDEIAETATRAFASINDRFKAEMLQASGKVTQDLTTARELFEAETKAIRDQLEPLVTPAKTA